MGMMCSASSRALRGQGGLATVTSQLDSLIWKICSNLNNSVIPGPFGALGEEFVPCSLLGTVEKQSLSVPRCHLCHCLGGQEQPQEWQHNPWGSAQLGLSLCHLPGVLALWLSRLTQEGEQTQE